MKVSLQFNLQFKRYPLRMILVDDFGSNINNAKCPSAVMSPTFLDISFYFFKMEVKIQLKQWRNDLLQSQQCMVSR
ncbi:CLUMA_CG002331, isoform A [Clunio marinus]|uniref:CLUMA_CG002331, isoform A n=1 Tax=Clunio marinus TaxID=568069 RepID=A0A1J1HPY0_9DIPT|nr:CLUMA_CG002331, isoform A [Clunio marinus]